MSPYLAFTRLRTAGASAQQALAEIGQHRPRVVDAGDAHAVTREGQRDATVADAVLEHGPAALQGEVHVAGHVLDALGVGRGVVAGSS